MSTSSAVSAAPSFPLSTHVAARAGSQAVILTLAIALTVAVSRRCPTSMHSLRRLSLEGCLALAFVVVALAFVYISAILLASGTSASSRACAGGVLLCFLSYGLAKLLSLFWFTERIYLVYTSSCTESPIRTQSKWYRASAVFMFAVFGAGMATLITRYANRNSEGTCYIGIGLWGGIVVVVLEGIANLYFLVALLLPLRSTWLNGSSGRRLAISGACAAAVAMVTSVTNISILTSMQDGQAAWVCVISCGFDLSINAMMTAFITSPPPRGSPTTLRRRPSFVSHFGTALPPVPVVAQGFGASPDLRDDGKRLATLSSPQMSMMSRRSSEWGWAAGREGDEVDGAEGDDEREPSQFGESEKGERV